MTLLWETNKTHIHIAPQKLTVVAESNDSTPHGATAVSLCGVSLLTASSVMHLVTSTRAATCALKNLSPRNSDGDDRAASPGWGEPAPSKPLIWRLGAQTTDHFCDPLSNRDISNGRSRRYLLEHVSALAQIAKPRTGITSYREGLSLHLINNLKDVLLKRKTSLKAKL